MIEICDLSKRYMHKKTLFFQLYLLYMYFFEHLKRHKSITHTRFIKCENKEI